MLVWLSEAEQVQDQNEAFITNKDKNRTWELE